MTSTVRDWSRLLWSVTDLLRTDFRPAEYGSVILPMVLLRRMGRLPDPADPLPWPATGEVAELLAPYGFDRTVIRLREAGLLAPVVERFARLDLGPRAVSDDHMQHLFEDLVRTTIESAGEGEFSTPQDVNRLIAALLVPDGESGGRTVYDPVCGNGGTLFEVAERIKDAEVYGQEPNPQSYAICRSTMFLKRMNPDHIAYGDVLTDDKFPDARFDYLVAAPPMGVDWKRAEAVVRHDARFAAGLPRVGDGSLLFLQHLLAKAKPAEEGGSRIAILFNASPLHTGAVGSGESQIRRWILENDLLEGVVALPDQLLSHTGTGTYVWILTNRKERELAGRVILLNARDDGQRMHRSVRDKRKYLAAEQIDAVVAAYRDALAVSRDPLDPRQARLRVPATEDFGYQRVVIERPLRARFDLTEKSHARLGRRSEGLAEALRPLIGTSWKNRRKALGALRATAKAAGRDWPDTAEFSDFVSRALRVRDPQGEIQRGEPDPALRTVVTIALHTDPDDCPKADDAWIDRDAVQIGYEIRLSHFFVRTLNAEFDHLERFATRVTTRPGGDAWPQLTAQNLHTADSAADLPETAPGTSALTVCTGGHLVGWPGNWRLLPSGFGEAATAMFVLQPLGGYGRTLAEWLNSRPDPTNATRMTSSQLMDTPVPVDLVEPEIEGFLEAVQEGRRTMKATAASTLPNVFAGPQSDVRRLREEIRSAAQEARLIADLMRPVEDPVGRAEWSYPFHIASLARRVRIGSHPAEQKDGLLKLSEGIARVVGILALREIAARGGFGGPLRKSFHLGATFGTWTTLIRGFADGVSEPELPDLARIAGPDGVGALLNRLRELRNETHHAHGIRADFEIEKDVRRLKPHVIAAITAVNWLAANPWEWVERCEYLDESSYRILGLTLRGSHPGWEPFERYSTRPLKPQRVYVHGVPLWPFADVRVCGTCHTRELFLLNQAVDGTLILRSLEEHEITIGDPWP